MSTPIEGAAAEPSAPEANIALGGIDPLDAAPPAIEAHEASASDDKLAYFEQRLEELQASAMRQASIAGSFPSAALQAKPVSIADLINAHRVFSYIDDAMFDDDGNPRGDGHIASGQAVDFAFAALVASPCRTLDDVRAKVAYVLDGSVGDREPLTTTLTVECTELWGPGQLLTILLRSLGAPSPDESVA